MSGNRKDNDQLKKHRNKIEEVSNTRMQTQTYQKKIIRDKCKQNEPEASIVYYGATFCLLTSFIS